MAVTVERTVFFTMVLHFRDWVRVGNAYPSRDAAKEWVPFVRAAWKGLKTKVEPCKLSFVDGKLTEESRQLLDQKFNLDS